EIFSALEKSTARPGRFFLSPQKLLLLCTNPNVAPGDRSWRRGYRGVMRNRISTETELQVAMRRPGRPFYFMSSRPRATQTRSNIESERTMELLIPIAAISGAILQQP